MPKPTFSKLCSPVFAGFLAILLAACGGGDKHTGIGDTPANPVGAHPEGGANPSDARDASSDARDSSVGARDASGDSRDASGDSRDASLGDASDASRDAPEEAACPDPEPDGGPACGAGCATVCPVSHSCRTRFDCESMACTQQTCAEPTCADQAQNGSETDVNCGGTCTPCADTKKCKLPADCASGVCTLFVCQAPTCNDGIKNGTESDADCGGSCTSSLCAAGQKCKVKGDCKSSICSVNNICICPSGMTTVPILDAGGTYCIDSTEVTYAAYNVFINSNPNKANQPAYCAWNTTYIPANDWPRSPAEEALPVTSVDWCDAYAFCKGNNKHLCGKVGGGADPFTGNNVAAQNEWYNACSAQGVNTYPNSGAYIPNRCNGDGKASTTLPVIKSNGDPIMSSCFGGFNTLYDMSGNVWEWEDSCKASAGEDDECRVRGGSFASSAELLKCAADSTTVKVSFGDAGQAPITRHTTANDIGFRCCQ